MRPKLKIKRKDYGQGLLNILKNTEQKQKISPKKLKLERMICKAIKSFMDIQIKLNPHTIFYHIPNGGKRKLLEAIEFKRMGVRAGVADYVLNTKKTPIAYIEIKLPKSKLSPSQLLFASDCSYLNIPYKIAHSLDEFINIYQDLK